MNPRHTFRPTVEALEDRITPGGTVLEYREGVLLITPPSAQTSVQTIQINQQLGWITLPNDNMISVLGLKTAEGHTPVVNWTPT